MIVNDQTSSEQHHLVNFVSCGLLTVALVACLLAGANRGDAPRTELGLAATESAGGTRTVAPAANQASGWYRRYTLNVDLPTGAEQSVIVMAPPGGLELAVRDMTGDKVENDVVVTPALLHWPLTVLVNDGHNHFTVAISPKFPASSASDQGQASGRQRPGDLTALVPSGFKHHALRDRGGLPIPPGQEGFFPSVATSATALHVIASNSGRAPPPLLVTNI
jgi:hypothetical protein